MGERIGKILRGQIVTSILYILLGLCLICMPVETVNIICKLVFGVIMIVAGLYHVLIYVMEKLNATVLDLFSGGILLVLGGFLFFNPQVVIKLLPILLGAFVLIDSIWTLQGAFRLKRRGNGSWKLLLIGSLIFVGLGIALIVNPFQAVRYTVMFAGWILLCNGIVDLIFMIIIKRGMKELKKAVEEAVEEMEENSDGTSAGRWSFLKKDDVVAEQDLHVVPEDPVQEAAGSAAENVTSAGNTPESADQAAVSETQDTGSISSEGKDAADAADAEKKDI